MVFTVTLDFKDKINNSVLKEVEKSIKMLSGAKVYSGVIGEDERTSEMAHDSEFGRLTVYDHGPHQGEAVLDPKRPFVSAPVEKNIERIGSVLEMFLMGALNQKNIKEGLESCGETMSDLQKEAISSIGASVGGWAQFNGGKVGNENSPRTVETKGFSLPLHNQNHQPMPIKYEVELGGA